MDFNINFNPLSVKSENKTKHLASDIIYDTIIIGGGPSALTAAVYCMRKGLNAGIIAKEFGGQITETSSIENYLGYTYINGLDLAQKFMEQVNQFEIGILTGEKTTGIKNEKIKIIITDKGSEYKTSTIIIASGKSWRKLNIPGEKELTGKGVGYCTICDGPLFSGRETAVAGGGNSGIEAAIDLAKNAKKVTIIQMHDKLTADKILIDKLSEFNNIEILLEHEVLEITGGQKVESISVRDKKNNTVRSIKLDGIFIQIGLIPNTEFAADILETNSHGEIAIDCSCKTSASGIFACGDATTVPYKQIIIAAGEGAKAALSAYDYIIRELR